MTPTATSARDIASFANVPLDLAQTVVFECMSRGVDVRELRSERRQQYLVVLRRVIASQARQQGYSYTVIGRALNRDHTTIMSALGARSR